MVNFKKCSNVIIHMPNCRIIFHRHSGLGGLDLLPSGFAAAKLRPLLEKKMTNGSALRLIHDRVPGMPISKELTANFEKMVGNRAILRTWKKFDREWRQWTKANLHRADQGLESKSLSRSHSPDAALILDTNARSPGRIVNLLGHFPFEAAVENTEFLVMLSRSMERATAQDLGKAVEHMVDANEAYASCSLLRDFELMCQIASMDLDVVVFRNLGHLYLASLDRYDIPIAVDRFKVVNFAEFVREKGISIEADVEAARPSFAEESIGLLCSGEDFARETHERLALLQILLMGVINLPDMPKDVEERFACASELAIQAYDIVKGQMPTS